MAEPSPYLKLLDVMMKQTPDGQGLYAFSGVILGMAMAEQHPEWAIAMLQEARRSDPGNVMYSSATDVIDLILREVPFNG